MEDCIDFLNMRVEEDILSLIPQRPPFVMVDGVLYSDDLRMRTSFKVRRENVLVEEGRLREAGLVENIAQTAAAHAGTVAMREKKPVVVGYIGAVRNLEIMGLPSVGEELETEIEIGETVFDVIMIKGKVWCGEKLLAQCEMKIFPGMRPK
jgi:predicted hotdog family 3-hydroxylacyl-ACP dehydratase